MSNPLYNQLGGTVQQNNMSQMIKLMELFI